MEWVDAKQVNRSEFTKELVIDAENVEHYTEFRYFVCKNLGFGREQPNFGTRYFCNTKRIYKLILLKATDSESECEIKLTLLLKGDDEKPDTEAIDDDLNEFLGVCG